MDAAACSVTEPPAGGEHPAGAFAARLARADAALRGGGLVVAGGAGSGKTHLARTLLAGSGPVRWVRGARSARAVPFGAFLPLLGTVPATPDEALVVAYRALAASPSALVVDDAHLLDELSAVLLEQLARSEVRPILVTLRTGERVPDPITMLWKDGLLERLDLAPPTFQDCVGVAELLLGGHLQTASATLLHHLTAGNLSWLRQLVVDERASGRLRCTNGIWHWSGRARPGPAVTELVASELCGATDGVLRVLELVALAGRLDVDVVARLTAPRHVEEAAEDGLITVTADGARWTARPTHPLLADVVAERLSPPRARRLYDRLVDALRSGPPDPARGDRVRLGLLALRGAPDPDPRLLLAAAHQAAERLDPEDAARLAAAAGAAGAGFEAALLSGVAQAWVMRGAEAERAFRELAPGAAGDERRRLRLVQPRALNLALNLGRPEAAEVILDEATTSATAEGELLGARGLLAALGDRLDDARRAARRALARDDVSALARSCARCALDVVAALAGDGRPQPDRGEPVPPDAPMMVLPRAWWSAYGLGLAGHTTPLRAALARWDGADGLAAALLRADLEGWSDLVSGRLARALPLLAEFRAVLRGHGGGWTAPLELRLATALGISGQAAAARAAIERARSARHPAVVVFGPQFELAQAWAVAAEGSTSLAIRHARKAALLAGRSGQFAVEVVARHTAVTFGDKGQAERLTVLAQRLRGPRALGAAAHAAAFDAGDDAGMLTAANRFAGAGLMLAAAEAAAQAEAVARDRRDPGATATAAAAAARYVAECDGARTPALELAARPLAISERQRETAAMVAAGMSNREISERLGVSVRTVEGHVYHACLRLGVPNRASLAALLTRSVDTGGSRVAGYAGARTESFPH